jgi:hypothetical protein
MQPPLPPVPRVVRSLVLSVSMGVEGVGSGSGALEAVEKSVAKKSIDEFSVQRRQCGSCGVIHTA